MEEKSFTYVPHPRMKELEEEGPIRARTVAKKRLVNASGAQKFNRRLGLAITTSVGTMWAAYAFFALSLVGLPSVIAKGDPVQIVAWIAQDEKTTVLLNKVAMFKAALAKR